MWVQCYFEHFPIYACILGVQKSVRRLVVYSAFNAGALQGGTSPHFDFVFNSQLTS